MIYVVEAGVGMLDYVGGYTSDQFLLNRYVQQMQSTKTNVLVRLYNGSEKEFLDDPKESMTEQMKLKPHPSEDGDIMIVLTDRLRESIKYCIPEDFISGYLGNMASYLTYIIMVLDEYPELRAGITEDQQKAMSVMIAYVWAIFAEGIHSTEIDHIKLIARLWGWT